MPQLDRARLKLSSRLSPVRRPIRTERLVLRAPRRSDASAFALLAGDRRVAENTGCIPSPCSVEEASQWIADGAGRPAAYMITVSGEVAGACSLEGCDGVPELGHWIGVPYWGCGYATEAARGLMQRAFGELGHRAITARARVSNPAARRVLEKCGFTWTGVGLRRIRAIGSSVPVDRFVVERRS